MEESAIFGRFRRRSLSTSLAMLHQGVRSSSPHARSRSDRCSGAAKKLITPTSRPFARTRRPACNPMRSPFPAVVRWPPDQPNGGAGERRRSGADLAHLFKRVLQTYLGANCLRPLRPKIPVAAGPALRGRQSPVLA